MQLTIDNFDSLGPLDYSCALEAGRPVRIRRRLNQAAEVRADIVLGHTGLVVPAAGARVIARRSDGRAAFTGYLAAPPDYEYLGWGERGPMYRYHLLVVSDELLLDRKRLSHSLTFTARAAGSCLKRLTESLLPGVFDTSSVTDGDVLPSFTAGSVATWSEHAARLALLARASYRVLDGKIVFTPVGTVRHQLSPNSPGFLPSALTLHSTDTQINDLAVVGGAEPRMYVKDYFLGDGLTLSFPLSEAPFDGSNQTLFEDEFSGVAPDGLIWAVTDPSQAVSVAAGALVVQGGTAKDAETTLEWIEPLELGGALAIDHGDISFPAASDGVIGGLYAGPVAIANCIAGFRVTPSARQSAIRALVSGAPAGPTITTAAGHRYGLRTRLCASERYRLAQMFHSSGYPSGSGIGGGTVAADVRVILEVHDVNPATPGSEGVVSTVLYDAVLSGLPAICTYALVNAANLHCSIPYARLRRMVNAEIRSAVAGGNFRTRLLGGGIAEGAECAVSSQALLFYPQYVPAANEQIVVRYRSSGTALARISDPARAAALARGEDNGARIAVLGLAAPPPRTSAECESAALALLDDHSQSACNGEYESWSDFFPPDGASDVFPGDALGVPGVNGAAGSDAIIREVEMELRDLANDRSYYKIRFATDAAEPLAFAFDATRVTNLPQVTGTAGSPSPFIADLRQAEITAVTSTTCTIDAGVTAPAGGGIEVRRSDTGWGTDADRNLIGRFTSQIFTLTRLTRVQDYYLRQYDASTPPRYSRYSTALHVDYPY
jgi:hypothetical protein